MNESTGRREMEPLVQGYLEESLTEEESRRLLASLRQDSALVTTILENLRMDCLIRSVVSDIATVEDVGQEDKILSIPHPAEISHAPARLGRCRRRWPQVLALAACLALLVGLSVWFFGPTMGEPALEGIQGVDVSIERGTEFVPAANGMRLQSADVLRVGTNDTASIVFGRENTRIDVRAGTELNLASFKRGKRFNLLSGTIQASVARQRPFQAMIITTPNAEARVLGTEFSLTVTTNRTQLDVTEGEVRLTRRSDGAGVKVNAGHYAVAATGHELAALSITGRVLREVWRHVQGNEVHDLTLHPGFPDRPDQRDFPAALETLTETNDTFGVRLRGYLIPEETDDYTFILSASGTAALWLSEDDSPENRVRIAQASADAQSGTLSRSRLNATQRQSAPVRLERGRRYYMEVVHVHSVGQGEPALKVAWTRHEGKAEEIPGGCVAPFVPQKGRNR